MLEKNDPQIDVFTHMIFERLIPKDHLLVLINSLMKLSENVLKRILLNLSDI